MFKDELMLKNTFVSKRFLMLQLTDVLNVITNVTIHIAQLEPNVTLTLKAYKCIQLTAVDCT